jgi:hypothetical protein
MGKEPATKKAQGVNEEIRQFAVKLREKVYGGQVCPDWGTLFTEIEELGVQIGDAVCREFVQQSVSQQAQTGEQGGQEHRCPTCDSPVKGTEKFWSEAGSDTMLQLRADYLSDTDPMPAFWEKWQKSATGQRCYSTAT